VYGHGDVGSCKSIVSGGQQHQHRQQCSRLQRWHRDGAATTAAAVRPYVCRRDSGAVGGGCAGLARSGVDDRAVGGCVAISVLPCTSSSDAFTADCKTRDESTGDRTVGGAGDLRISPCPTTVI